MRFVGKPNFEAKDTALLKTSHSFLFGETSYDE